jgi:hypothetical protein
MIVKGLLTIARGKQPMMPPGTLRYVPTLSAAIAFLLLIAGNLLLFLGRHREGLRSELLMELLPDHPTHISNFCISLLLVVIPGQIWLMMGIGARLLAVLAATIILTNWVYEAFLPFVNVPDLRDAWYGTAGALLGLLFLLVVKRVGLRPSSDRP